MPEVEEVVRHIQTTSVMDKRMKTEEWPALLDVTILFSITGPGLLEDSILAFRLARRETT